jgi:hypothetical protein
MKERAGGTGTDLKDKIERGVSPGKASYFKAAYSTKVYLYC